jgi:hypothetical protein
MVPCCCPPSGHGRREPDRCRGPCNASAVAMYSAVSLSFSNNRSPPASTPGPWYLIHFQKSKCVCTALLVKKTTGGTAPGPGSSKALNQVRTERSLRTSLASQPCRRPWCVTVMSSPQNTKNHCHSSDPSAAACHQSELCHNATLVAPGVRSGSPHQHRAPAKEQRHRSTSILQGVAYLRRQVVLAGTFRVMNVTTCTRVPASRRSPSDGRDRANTRLSQCSKQAPLLTPTDMDRHVTVLPCYDQDGRARAHREPHSPNAPKSKSFAAVNAGGRV